MRVKSLSGGPSKPHAGRRRTVVLALLVVLGVVAGVAPMGIPAKFVFGLVGTAALFVLIYFNIQFGIVLFFILNLTIPQAGPSWNVGMNVSMLGEPRGLHFNLHEIVMLMVLLAWLLKIFLKDAEWNQTSPLFLPIILYVATSILASFVGLMHGGSELIVVFRFTRTVFFAYIFFVFLNNVTTRKQLKQLVIVLLICATLVAAFGLVQKVMGQTWAENFAKNYLAKLGFPADVNYVAGGSGETQVYRINSTFLHPNILGAYNIIVLPFFISLLWFYTKRWQRALLIGGICIQLPCLLYTGSRAAWIAAGAFVILYGLIGLLDKRMILAGAAVLLIIVLVVMLFKPPDFVKKRFVTTGAKEATTARVYQYKIAADFFMEFPIFGLGVGMEGKRIVMANNVRSLWGAVENAFLTYLVSHGLLGFTAFLLLFIFFLGMMMFAHNGAPEDPFIRYHSEAFFLAMVGIIITSQFGAWLIFAIPMWTLFWAFMGMGGCLYNRYREVSPARSWSKTRPFAIPGAAPMGGGSAGSTRA